MRYHRRIFVLNFSADDIPRFTTDKEAHDFHAAIGRMVMYGLHAQADNDEDTVSLVTGGLTDKGTEVCCAYHATLDEYPEKWPDGSTKVLGSTASQINDLLSELVRKGQQKWRAFVMAGINRGDHWSFHS